MRNLISFGPNIRNNEAMVFRNRASSETIILTNRTSNAGIFITCERVRDLDLAPLRVSEERMRFSSDSLVNERDNIDLSNIEFTLTKEPIHTADGAVVVATMAVTFRLDPDMLPAFLNYHSRNFAETFVSRCRSALVAEIGSHQRDGIIAAQIHLRDHLERKLRDMVVGAPGDDVAPGLGIVVDKVTLVLEPPQSTAADGHGEPDPITSLDSMRRVVDIMRHQDDREMQRAVQNSFNLLIEAQTRRDCAKLLGANSHLIIMTPHELGLTAGMTAHDQIGRSLTGAIPAADKVIEATAENSNRPALLKRQQDYDQRRQKGDHVVPRRLLPPGEKPVYH